MRRSDRLATILFWAMMLAGVTIVIPCLILPAWLEYQAALQLRAIRQHQVNRHEAELARLRKQREHLETDDAYALRLAQRDLNLPPLAQRIPVEPAPLPEPAGPDTAPVAAAEDTLAPELSALLDEALRRYPLAWLFTRPDTRPRLLIMGGGLILTALVLLGTPARRQPTHTSPH